MLARLSQFVLPSIVFLVPLLSWTLTPNFFDTPKHILIIFSTSLLIFTYAWDMIRTQRLVYSSSKLVTPLLLFALALIASLVVNSTGRTEAIVGRGSLYLSCIILAYFASMAPRQVRVLTLHSYLISASILAVFSLLTVTLLHSQSWLPAIMQSSSFTPTGSPLTSLIIFTTALVPALYGFYQSSSLRSKLLFATCSIFLLLGGVTCLSPLPSLLPYSAAWSVALDAMYTLPKILFGVGLENFATHYTSVKPLAVNSTPLWNILPQSSTSELLHLWSTTGIVGLLTFLHLLIRALVSHDYLVLPILALALIVAPGTIPVTLIFFLMLGLTHTSTPITRPLPSRTHSVTLPLLLVASTSYCLFLASFPVRAELHLGQANQALAVGNGRLAYEHTLRAVELVPKMTNYRLAYSALNLQLASALSQKESLSEEERASVTQLVSQAVREGRAATSLQPNSALAWNSLGNVYRQLINVAEGASDFAVSSYTQAVSLDPANPALRIELGRVYSQLAQSEEDPDKKSSLLDRAREQYLFALELKSDYPAAQSELKQLESEE